MRLLIYSITTFTGIKYFCDKLTTNGQNMKYCRIVVTHFMVLIQYLTVVSSMKFVGFIIQFSSSKGQIDWKNKHNNGQNTMDKSLINDKI